MEATFTVLDAICITQPMLAACLGASLCEHRRIGNSWPSLVSGNPFRGQKIRAS